MVDYLKREGDLWTIQHPKIVKSILENWDEHVRISEQLHGRDCYDSGPYPFVRRVVSEIREGKRTFRSHELVNLLGWIGNCERVHPIPHPYVWREFREVAMELGLWHHRHQTIREARR